jgi:hypothetical protein
MGNEIAVLAADTPTSKEKTVPWGYHHGMWERKMAASANSLTH